MIVSGVPIISLAKAEKGPDDLTQIVIKDQLSLGELVYKGIRQESPGAYKRLMLPPLQRAYLLDFQHTEWAVGYLLQNPKYLAHALDSSRRRAQNEEGEQPISLGADPRAVLGLLRSVMHRNRIERISDLEALTWPGHRLPFVREGTFWNRINNLRGSIGFDGKQWKPLEDPQARLLLQINHWRVLVDLSESFAAGIDEKAQTTVCRQFDGSYELLSWLEGIRGAEGKSRVLTWNNKMQLPRLSSLGALRDWMRHLAPLQPDRDQEQLSFLEEGVWEWLDGKGAFSEPVRHSLQGRQEQNVKMREKILMHQAGSLVHPGYPEQTNRRFNDAPGVEIYRPLNPFGGHHG